MNSTKRAFRYKLIDIIKSVGIFWIVIFIVDIASIFLNLRYGNQNTFYFGLTNTIDGQSKYSIFGANIMPILIYFIVISYTNYYEDFPRMLNFSITRKTIFKANLFSNVAVAFIFALVQSILIKLDLFLVEMIGKKPLYEFFLFNTQIDSWIFILISLFMTFLTFISLWQLIASLNYKFGMKIWAVFLAIILIGNNVIVNSYSFFDLVFPGQWVNRRMDISTFMICALIIIISQISIYLVNKTTDLKKSIS